ncbi:NAD-dependent epimerase/dehydratase family protein [Bosea sp. RCC_152_1]|uniref:NAD-dependent epimerase/dehydratase family protein n=1 Tax=Bosea sp. RCC_152_1 TaxID=3239228 RepID=UPI003524E63C
MPARYLVTGGAGFIGRYLCAELLEHGHEVRVLDSFVPQVHGDAADAPPGVELLTGDVRDADLVRRALGGVDGVFHLAAEVGVGQSMYEIARYVGGNDLATAVLLEQISQSQVQRLVVASSMSVYGEGLYRSAEGELFPAVRRVLKEGERAWDPAGPDGQPLLPVATDETKPVDLASIYALTKYVQECSSLIIGNAYGVQTVALRLFNVFGPGQALSNPYTGVLANFGSRLLNGQPPLIFEDGRQKRDFVHVSDVAKAFHLAMHAAYVSGQVLNIGSGNAYTIEAVALLLAEAMGRPELRPQILQKARAGDIRHCFADISRARDIIGYLPARRLEASMDEMAEWIAGSQAVDGGEQARRQLEARGLVV